MAQLKRDQPETALHGLEERKLKEIEHSRVRRSILQGFERRSDTNKQEEAADLGNMIRDRDAFEHHFSNAKFYAITHLSERYQYGWLKEKCKPGRKILDFACGSGENGIYAAQCGAETIGIDISPEGVANANLNAKKLKVDDHCKFVVMDGENMSFPDNTFDLGVEYGALHHVDLNRAMPELARVLKPEAEMICVEALRHNPLIHWYRKRTPHLRTEWEVEHILGVEELAVLRKYFHEVEVKFFHLAALASVPFRKTFLFKPLRSMLDLIDRVMLNNQIIGKYAWIMIVTIKKPRKLS
jgi:ubiquinone/menaquinone biosynthesis C-methylase UbiE